MSRDAVQRHLFRICVIAVALAATPLFAIERRPLPDVILTALDGASVHAPTLASDERWLLIYVRPDCAPCQSVLQLVKVEEYPALPGRMVIVVQGTVDQAREMKAAFADLQDARWYADADGAAATALRIATTPTITGMLNTSMEWSVAGVFRKGVEMKSVLVSWTEKP
jgi:hypothetical protein